MFKYLQFKLWSLMPAFVQASTPLSNDPLSGVMEVFGYSIKNDRASIGLNFGSGDEFYNVSKEALIRMGFPKKHLDRKELKFQPLNVPFRVFVIATYKKSVNRKKLSGNASASERKKMANEFTNFSIRFISA